MWGAVFCVTIVLALINPDARSVVVNYRNGSELFLAGEQLYDIESAMGYLYSPAFAVLYVPFYELGPHLGDFLWRLLGFSVLTFAAVRQAQVIDDEKPLWLLSCGLFLATPVAAGALRNGQATILLAGACWLLVLAALENAWLRTLLWTAVAIVAKPTAIVAMLLAGALRPRLIPVLVLAVAAVLILPYAFAPSGYVTEITRSFFSLMDVMSLDKTQSFRPADFTAPFTAIGIMIPPPVATAIRVVAALATLAAAFHFARYGDRRTAALAIVVLASFYMCVFNPRVEGNTYAMLAVPFGLSISLMYRRQGATSLSVVLGALLFVTGLSGVDIHLHRLTDFWMEPVMCTLVFLGIMRWFWKYGQATEVQSRSTASVYG